MVMVFALMACATDGTANTDRLTGRDWQATRLNGEPVSTPAPVALSFADGRGAGRSGCNRYSGKVVVGDGTISFSEIISTRMACADAGAMQTEGAYLQALGGVQRWAVSGDNVLTLSGSKGRIEFAPSPASPRR